MTNTIEGFHLIVRMTVFILSKRTSIEIKLREV